MTTNQDYHYSGRKVRAAFTVEAKEATQQPPSAAQDKVGALRHTRAILQHTTMQLQQVEQQRDEALVALKDLSQRIKTLTLGGGVNIYHPDRVMLAVSLETADELIAKLT